MSLKKLNNLKYFTEETILYEIGDKPHESIVLMLGRIISLLKNTPLSTQQIDQLHSVVAQHLLPVLDAKKNIKQTDLPMKEDDEASLSDYGEDFDYIDERLYRTREMLNQVRKEITVRGLRSGLSLTEVGYKDIKQTLSAHEVALREIDRTISKLFRNYQGR
ncbi:MAG: hypothetical protein UT24_C0054G0007 [Candidatus Woesebacteria bacterium GW2011_GWB1_39_12]|uniref:Uncharacterized protein n=1 Tax=Candidatus Woesebacteria bacterium GW2011_GWB1_39_12 TaxID=1618574 RepID=A0A0G0LYM6_9BACT|nr:MAG: hypothetical protein UT24_C0054G0007 [Candidatus Woesebacteria bacterium GW2011_GWB1_39_12]